MYLVASESLMATTTPDINCAGGALVDAFQDRLVELTNIMLRRLPILRRIAQQRLNNVADAEDAVQDALLAAYTHVRQFRGQAQLSTWLTSIVINSARMKVRRQRRRMHIVDGLEQGDEQPSLAESLADHRPDPEQVYRRRELSEMLDRSFRRLSPTTRRTLQLRTVQGLTIRETAQFLGVPVGTVKAQLARARRKLQEMMRLRSG